MKVLVLQLKRIGDLILTTPVLAALKSKGAQVTVVVDGPCSSLLPAMPGVDEALRRMAATMACHAAVKANDPLTREKMQYLLDELRRDLSERYMREGISINETAFLLGYSEATAFHRSFRRWTGRTPRPR